MKRRDALTSTAAAMFAGSMLGCVSNPSTFQNFSAEEAGTLAAFANQLIPDDEHAPGAVRAGVLRFLDRQLARAYAQHKVTYRMGLAALERSAQHLHSQQFSKLHHEVQEALVERMETGDLPESIWGDLPPREFFRLLRLHVMQGYYGDPRHGGNCDRVSWRMIGVPYPPVRGRDDYRLPAESGFLSEPDAAGGVR